MAPSVASGDLGLNRFSVSCAGDVADVADVAGGVAGGVSGVTRTHMPAPFAHGSI